jgi:hypothetical protein
MSRNTYLFLLLISFRLQNDTHKVSFVYRFFGFDVDVCPNLATISQQITLQLYIEQIQFPSEINTLPTRPPCVQQRLVCSAGVSPARVKTRAL